MNKDFTSALEIKNILFEKILFERKGTKTDEKELKINFQCDVYTRESDDTRKITLTFKGSKEFEYDIEIVLTAFFGFKDNEDISEDMKDILVNNNAVAIMMPYIRSQVSLITAQPNVDCVVLPPFNINKLLERE